jgi:hypothetical protein
MPVLAIQQTAHLPETIPTHFTATLKQSIACAKATIVLY